MQDAPIVKIMKEIAEFLTEDMLVIKFSYIWSTFSNLLSICNSLPSFTCIFYIFQLDNRGNRLIVSDDSAINTPAVAAAHVTKRYTSQDQDEISFEVKQYTQFSHATNIHILNIVVR